MNFKKLFYPPTKRDKCAAIIKQLNYKVCGSYQTRQALDVLTKGFEDPLITDDLVDKIYEALLATQQMVADAEEKMGVSDLFEFIKNKGD